MTVVAGGATGGALLRVILAVAVVLVATSLMHVAKSSALRLVAVAFILFYERRMLANNGLVEVGDVRNKLTENGSNAATRTFPRVVVVMVMMVVLSPCRDIIANKLTTLVRLHSAYLSLA